MTRPRPRPRPRLRPRPAAAPPSEWSARRYTLGGAFVLALTFGGGGLWAATATLAGAVVAPAEVRVETQAKPVSHPEGGVVAAIHVREGQAVQAGAPLIDFDATSRRASAAIYSDELASLRARRARLLAERDGAARITFPGSLLRAARDDDALRDALADQRSLFAARRESTRQRIEQLAQRRNRLLQEIEGARARGKAAIRNLAVARDQRDRRRNLFERGYATRDSVQTAERESATLEGEITAILARIRGFERQIDETTAQRSQIDEEHRERALAELRETEDRIGERRERSVVAVDALGKATVVAPQDGIVQSLAVHAPGAVLGAGEVILTIVPVTDRLVLEARVPARDRDRLYPGQVARVRFSAFNQRQTPELEAGITLISPDRVIDEATGRSFYDIVLVASEAELARLGEGRALLPGMPADLFIATEERTALSYLLKPFTDFMQTAGRER